MTQETVIQSTVTPKISIVVQGEEGTEPQRWTMCVDYRALAHVEEEVGLDLKKPGEWEKIKSGSTFPKIVWCCLRRYSPDVTLDQVTDCLNPQAHAILWNALYDVTFPGLREAVSEWRKKAKADGTDPNEQPGVKTA